MSCFMSADNTDAEDKINVFLVDRKYSSVVTDSAAGSAAATATVATATAATAVIQWRPVLL
jgi:hypothetical protein